VGVNTTLPQLRSEHRLTQEDLAGLLGVSRQTVNSIETGRFEPSLSLALKIAVYFKRPVEAIFSVN
jgi:putative transcriptional regulator